MQLERFDSAAALSYNRFARIKERTMKVVVVIDSKDFESSEFNKVFRKAKVSASLEEGGWAFDKPSLTCLEDDNRFLEVVKEALS